MAFVKSSTAFLAALMLWAEVAVAQISSWQPTDGDVIAFDVFRKGDKFGSHVVRFEQNGDTLEVVTDVNLRVGFGPVTLFSYALDATEIWRNGTLVSLNGRVKEGGDVETVRADRAGNQLTVKGSGFSGAIDGAVLPSSHWNDAVLNSAEILSTENGERLPIAVSKGRPDRVNVNGTTIDATRYDIKASIPYSIWYDAEGRWVKLEFQARGDTIEYRLRSLY